MSSAEVIERRSRAFWRRQRRARVRPRGAGVSAIHVHDRDQVSADDVLVELDRTVTQAERKRVGQDLVASLLDVARLSALRRSFNDLTAPHDIEEPTGASAAEIARARSSMLAQAAQQEAKLASVVQQMRYRTTHVDDANLRQRMRAIAQERRRFGYRRLHVLLRREG